MRVAVSEQSPELAVTVYEPVPVMVLVVPVVLAPPAPVQVKVTPGVLLASLAVRKVEPSAQTTTLILASGIACTVTVSVAVAVLLKPPAPATTVTMFVWVPALNVRVH